MRLGVPPVGQNIAAWANDLRRWLERNWDSLSFRASNSVATQDGMLIWDAAGYPVISKGGEWRQIVLADGYAQFIQDADITAAAADTAYAVTFDAPPLSGGVSQGTPASRIVFEEGGLYLLSFTAQISSSSASTVSFRFWPAINGASVAGSTIFANLHQNDASTVVSRAAIFQVAAGDYLEVMWATSSTSGLLKAEPATAYSPASPSATLSVTRLRA